MIVVNCKILNLAKFVLLICLYEYNNCYGFMEILYDGCSILMYNNKNFDNNIMKEPLCNKYIVKEYVDDLIEIKKYIENNSLINDENTNFKQEMFENIFKSNNKKIEDYEKKLKIFSNSILEIEKTCCITDDFEKAQNIFETLVNMGILPSHLHYVIDDIL